MQVLLLVQLQQSMLLRPSIVSYSVVLIHWLLVKRQFRPDNTALLFRESPIDHQLH